LTILVCLCSVLIYSAWVGEIKLFKEHARRNNKDCSDISCSSSKCVVCFPNVQSNIKVKFLYIYFKKHFAQKTVVQLLKNGDPSLVLLTYRWLQKFLRNCAGLMHGRNEESRVPLCNKQCSSNASCS